MHYEADVRPAFADSQVNNTTNTAASTPSSYQQLACRCVHRGHMSHLIETCIQGSEFGTASQSGKRNTKRGWSVGRKVVLSERRSGRLCLQNRTHSLSSGDKLDHPCLRNRDRTSFSFPSLLSSLLPSSSPSSFSAPPPVTPAIGMDPLCWRKVDRSVQLSSKSQPIG